VSDVPDQSSVPAAEMDAVAAAEIIEAIPLPGSILREAREARGLSVADVASALKFSPRQIEALEADDFSCLQGATFVRGFVRSYARFLKLAPESLLAMLDGDTAIAAADVRPPEDTGVAMPMPGERNWSFWVAGAGLLVAAAAGLVGWHFLSAPEPVAAVRSEAAIKAPVVEVQPTMQSPTVQPPLARIEQPAAGDGSAAAAPSSVALPPDGRQLVITFSDKSWVEVKDASQRVVLSGEFPGGDRQTANGKAPFQLWVGRASAVRVFDGEREIDVKPHARDEVARLTVD